MQNLRGRWGPGTCQRKRSPSRENGPRRPQLLAFQQRGPTMSRDSTEWKGRQYVPEGRTLARVAFAGAPPLRPRLLCCVEQADTRGVSSERCLHHAADWSRPRSTLPMAPAQRARVWPHPPCAGSHLSPQYTAQGRFYVELTPSYAPGSQCGLWLGRSSGSQALLQTSIRPSFNKIPGHWSPRYRARSFGLHRRYSLPPASGSSLGVTCPLQLPSLSPRQWLPRPEVL